MIIKAFATPIYHSDFLGTDEEFTKIQNEVRGFYTTYADKMDLTWGDSVYTTVGLFKNVLDELPSLKSYIDFHMLSFVRHEVKIIKSWMNMTKMGGFQNYHHHLTEPDVCGVYYFDTNGDDGDLMFKTDSGGLIHSKLFGQDNTIRIKPKVGRLVLFPSFLEHAVAMNKTNTPRISISFNGKV